MNRLWILLLLLTFLPARPVYAADSGVEFTIRYSGDRYTVTMRPTSTPAHPGLTLAAQVTVKVAHGVGSQRFVVSDLQSHVADTRWTARSRVDAPKEDRTADYISFELSFPTQNFAAIRWQAGQALDLFSFRNSGPCLGRALLLENGDPFLPPNSLGTNPGNQIDILGLPAGNRYLGIYERGRADCRSADGVERTAVVLAERLVTRQRGTVQVQWTTANESQVLGFQLYRQDGAGVTQLTAEPLVAQASGTPNGASYHFTDQPSDPSAYALYLLEVLDLAGQSERVVLGAINGQPLFLPLVIL